jgi:hypothetical protein
MPPNAPKRDRSVGWNAFFKHAGGKHQEWALARFAAYCCSRQIEPEGVSDSVMNAFRNYLDARLLGKDPAKLCKEMAQTWNGIVTRNTLRLGTLTYPPSPQYRCRPLATYPVSLQDEIAAYLKRRAVVDLFVEDSPNKSLSLVSLRNTQAHLTQFLDALASTGADPTGFTCLADVVTPENMKSAFLAHNARRGLKGASGSLQNIAATLVVVARDHLRVDPEELEDMLKT